MLVSRGPLRGRMTEVRQGDGVSTGSDVIGQMRLWRFPGPHSRLSSRIDSLVRDSSEVWVVSRRPQDLTQCEGVAAVSIDHSWVGALQGPQAWAVARME